VNYIDSLLSGLIILVREVGEWEKVKTGRAAVR